MKNIRGFQFGFAWIFAIFIGAIIIFLAVYASTSIIGIKRYEEEARTGAKLSSLLNPISTNLEQAKLTPIFLQDETIIFNECDSDSLFGEQSLSVSLKTLNEFEKYSGPKSTFKDRYLFSNKTLYGKEKFYVLSMPFEFPFKTADIIMLWPDTEKYCFVNPAPDLKKELERLNLTNVELKDSLSKINECPTESKKVCFQGRSNSQCDILQLPSLSGGEVTHRTDSGDITITYVHSFNNKFSLLYASIFSNPEIYECQLKRIMGRAGALATTYESKFNYLKGACLSSGATFPSLEDYSDSALHFPDSSALPVMKSLAQQVKDKNDALKCRLF